MGKTFSNVSTNFTTTFNIDSVGGAGRILNAKIEQMHISRQTDDKVVLGIKTNPATTDGVGYRFSATAPLITLS